MVVEIDLNNLNNEHMMKYIKKLQETLEQYKAWEKASFMAPRMREEASIKTPKARTEAFHMQFKEKAKIEDEESSNKAPKDVDWKVIRVIQRYQKEQEEDYGLDDASSLSKEILAQTFLLKFKLSNLDKYDGKADPGSHLAIFRTIMQL